MALIKCSECGRNVSDKASACPNCGCPISAMELHHEEITPIKEKDISKNIKFSKKHKILILLVVIAAIGVIGISLSNKGEPDIGGSEIKVESYLQYIGEYIEEGENIKIPLELYENIDNVNFMGISGKILFSGFHNHLSDCEWISTKTFSETEYRDFAKKLEDYFGDTSEKKNVILDSEESFHYFWTDKNNGYSVSMVHDGIDGPISVMWQVNENTADFLDHDWIPATNTQPKTCRMCGQTEGEPASVDLDSVLRSAETHAIHGRTDDIEEIIDEYYDIMTIEEKTEILELLGISMSLEAVEDEIIPNLKSPRSYHRYSFEIPDFPIYSEEDDEYFIMIDLKYGATNSYGAEITKTISATYRFTIDLEEAKAYTSDVSIWDF